LTSSIEWNWCKASSAVVRPSFVGVDMKNWPFNGLRTDRRGEKWPKFQRRHRWNRIDEIHVSSSGIMWQSTILTKISATASASLGDNNNNDGKDNYSLATLDINILIMTASLHRCVRYIRYRIIRYRIIISNVLQTGGAVTWRSSDVNAGWYFFTSSLAPLFSSGPAGRCDVWFSSSSTFCRHRRWQRRYGI
jgi:hypothetical protein